MRVLPRERPEHTMVARQSHHSWVYILFKKWVEHHLRLMCDQVGGLLDSPSDRIPRFVCMWEASINPIWKLIEGGDIDAVKQLVHAGVLSTNHNVSDVYGSCPLMAAVWYKQLTIAQILLTSPDVDVNACTDNEITALHFAVYRGDAVMVEFLLLYGAEPDVTNASGNTPMHCVVDFIPPLPDLQPLDITGHVESWFRHIQILNGEPDPWVPQIDAEYLERMAIACILILFDADINACNKDQHTPQEWASLNNDVHMSILFLQLQEWINGVDPIDHIRGALHYIDACVCAIGKDQDRYLDYMEWDCVVSSNTFPDRFIQGNPEFSEYQESADINSSIHLGTAASYSAITDKFSMVRKKGRNFALRQPKINHTL